ncbi:MAG: DoxX family protein [Chlorobiales bacterium]|nr:DoxX family protein [Chlorobiales bacterium]
MITSQTQSVIHGFARVSTAIVWIYHGIVPKLIFTNPDELKLIQAGGVSADTALLLLPVVGIIETGIGLLLLATWAFRWPFFFSAAAMVVSLIGVTVTSPAYLVGAFNPFSLNIATFSLSVIGALSVPREVTPPSKSRR